MALVGLYGAKHSLMGPQQWLANSVPAASNLTIDAANENVIMIGRCETSDGGSHTIDTSGSSALNWRPTTVTFANAGTTVKVGIAAVDTSNGPPGRASHASDVISFDVSKSLTGGGGGITDAWQSHVPDAGTKTIANGDLIAFCIQMTARAGADTMIVRVASANNNVHRPTVTTFAGGSYSAGFALPNCFFTFSDGATGWLSGSDVFSVISTRTWNSGSATKEYGQLYKMPAPLKIYGCYGWISPDNDTDIVLYSDPLGTPVAEKTVSIDANTASQAAGRRFEEWFSSPYQTTAGQNVGIVFKPGASNISAYYKTQGHASNRAADVWGTDGYGISRASGAFSDANSSLDHYYIGLIVGAFEHGVWPSGHLGV